MATMDEEQAVSMTSEGPLQPKWELIFPLWNARMDPVAEYADVPVIQCELINLRSASRQGGRRKWGPAV